ncbi:hypothetical protein COV77_00215 [Candidatus Pacearchaeota archaeon CG11_big_fil_rev_8_21_14_0_20_30_13]|nr:MAG: hypothetical protein COV77_00215 [Candidatus Pacearchaeota archaeon CG11_big_fil_rev_8_21_14_0_20_30_13]
MVLFKPFGSRSAQKLNEKFGHNEVKPFTLCYAKCEVFCCLSRRSDKRSFSILSKTKAICPKDCGLFSRIFGGQKMKF